MKDTQKIIVGHSGSTKTCFKHGVLIKGVSFLMFLPVLASMLSFSSSDSLAEHLIHWEQSNARNKQTLKQFHNVGTLMWSWKGEHTHRLDVTSVLPRALVAHIYVCTFCKYQTSNCVNLADILGSNNFHNVSDRKISPFLVFVQYVINSFIDFFIHSIFQILV